METNKEEEIIYGLVSWKKSLGEGIPPYGELRVVKQFSAEFSKYYHNPTDEEMGLALSLAKELCSETEHYSIIRLTKFKIYQPMSVWATFSAEVYATSMQGAEKLHFGKSLFDAGLDLTLEEITSCLNHHAVQTKK